MIVLIRKYKSVLRFILTFLGSYLLLVLVYNAYLKYGGSTRFYPDFITHLVARQSEYLINALGYTAIIEPSTVEPAMNLTINGTALARIVEGCNAVSIIILFVAFMISFFERWKRTLLYIFAGIVLIYAMNITRIALLAIGIYKYPDYSHFLHGTVFPAILYGTVLLLWLGWIRSYKAPVYEA